MPGPITAANTTSPMVSAQNLPAPSWKERLFGTDPKAAIFQRFTQGQTPTLDWAQQLAQSGLSGMQFQPYQSRFEFGPIEQQARTGFTSKTIPSIMERFSSLGGQGTQSSSALPGVLGAAGAGLEESLAAMKQQYGLQQQQIEMPYNQNQQRMQLQMLMQLLGIGLQPRFDYSVLGGQSGAVQNVAYPIIQALAQMGATVGGAALMGM